MKKLLTIPVKGFIKKELLQALRDKRMKVLIFVLPVIQLLLFGYALTDEVKNIKIYFPHSINDTAAHNLFESAVASGWFIPVDEAAKSDVAVYAPAEGLTKSIGRGEGKVQLMIDAVNLVRAKSVELYLKNIATKSLALKNAQVNLSIRTLYNPSGKSSNFMVPAVICVIVCIFTIILTAMAIAKEKESGTFETLLSAPISSGEIIAGKTIPFFLIGLINMPVTATVGILLFSVPFKGSVVIAIIGAVLFLACTVSIGIFISSVAKNQQQAMMGGFMFVFPAIILSGMMFPVENMPLFFKIIAYMNPLTYFISLLRNIMLMGGSLPVIVKDLAMLMIFCLLLLTVSIKKFKRTL
jgi:ABC-2 type transport system permease protein